MLLFCPIAATKCHKAANAITDSLDAGTIASRSNAPDGGCCPFLPLWRFSAQYPQDPVSGNFCHFTRLERTVPHSCKCLQAWLWLTLQS
ncbi:MAG: hypothetical protein KME26_28760 [Oscillatoria princeps RMCB-10]|nr:hypothetical protein [Oscillatoria princeps RMCB-10]